MVARRTKRGRAATRAAGKGRVRGRAWGDAAACRGLVSHRQKTARIAISTLFSL
jgi:hypothetical protein